MSERTDIVQQHVDGFANGIARPRKRPMNKDPVRINLVSPLATVKALLQHKSIIVHIQAGKGKQDARIAALRHLNNTRVRLTRLKQSFGPMRKLPQFKTKSNIQTLQINEDWSVDLHLWIEMQPNLTDTEEIQKLFRDLAEEEKMNG